MSAPRVVIVGGGFGGLACARALDGRPVDVLLLDGRNYHLFTPLLYQVATSLLNAPDVAYPFRAIFRRSRNVRFRQAYVTEVHAERRVVVTSRGDELPYDYLVLATGSTNNTFGNERLAEVTHALKTLPEAELLRNHVLSCLELAARERDPDERRRLLTFVVVGGGPTGVEYAGALNELLKLVLGRDYPELRPGEARIVLVEGQERLLGALSPDLGVYAQGVLERRGIDVVTSALVGEASEHHVTLSNGQELETRTIVWSAGVRPAAPGGEALARTRSGRLSVDERLRAAGSERVLALGDAAAVSWDGGELPMLSPPAMQEGRYAARSVLAEIDGTLPAAQRPFRYRDKGTMATIGRNAAVASFGGLELKGFLGWAAWLTVHLYYLVGFRNRAAVFTRWGWTYVKKDRPIRLLLPVGEDEEIAALTAHESARGAPWQGGA